MRRTLTALLAIVVGVSGGVLVAAPPALAAPCNGPSCFGINPEGTCSGDGQGLRGRDYRVDGKASFRVELRYSPSCRAGWMRLIVFPGTGNQSYSGSAWNPGGPSVGFAGHSSPNTWTYMVDASPGKSICGGTHLRIDGVYRGWYDPGCVAR